MVCTVHIYEHVVNLILHSDSPIFFFKLMLQLIVLCDMILSFCLILCFFFTIQLIHHATDNDSHLGEFQLFHFFFFLSFLSKPFRTVKTPFSSLMNLQWGSCFFSMKIIIISTLLFVLLRSHSYFSHLWEYNVYNQRVWCGTESVKSLLSFRRLILLKPC